MEVRLKAVEKAGANVLEDIIQFFFPFILFTRDERRMKDPLSGLGIRKHNLVLEGFFIYFISCILISFNFL